MALQKYFQSILWEYKIDTLNIWSDIVAQRVLSLWDKKHSDFWMQELGTEKAQKIYLKNRNTLDKKSQNYWDKYFKIEQKSFSKSMYEQLHSPIFSRSFR